MTIPELTISLEGMTKPEDFEHIDLDTAFANNVTLTSGIINGSTVEDRVLYYRVDDENGEEIGSVLTPDELADIANFTENLEALVTAETKARLAADNLYEDEVLQAWQYLGRIERGEISGNLQNVVTAIRRCLKALNERFEDEE